MKSLSQGKGFLRKTDGRVCYDWRKGSSLLSGNLILKFLERHRDRLRGALLDVGCGERPYGILYDSLVTSYHAIDIPQPSRKIEITVAAVCESLPFLEARFDVVLCTEVLMHVDEPRRALQEIWRVLKPNGTLVLTTTFLYPTNEFPRDHWRFNHRGNRLMLTQAGFAVENMVAKAGFFSLVFVFIFIAAFTALRICLKAFGRNAEEMISVRLLASIPQKLWWWFLSPSYSRKLKTAGDSCSRYEQIFSMGYCMVARKT